MLLCVRSAIAAMNCGSEAVVRWGHDDDGGGYVAVAGRRIFYSMKIKLQLKLL